MNYSRSLGSSIIWVAFFLAANGATGQTLEQFAVSTWPSTVNYLGYAEFPARVDGQIRITAGQRYTLYLNGDLIGSDDDPSTVETYEVSFVRRENAVAVVVEHDGGSAPTGIFCTLETDSLRFVSSPSDREFSWFWSDFPLANEEGADWTDLSQGRLDRHDEDGIAVAWTPVQEGSLDPAAIEGFEDLDLTRAGSLAGFAGGVDGSRGGLQLRSLVGVNTAFDTFSDDPRLIDGDITTSVTFRKGANSLLQRVETDLGRLVRMNRVRVITTPPNNGSLEDVSLRGYSILVSKDGISFLEVGARNGITNFSESEVVFQSIVARHVRLVVTEFSNRNASPRVGELEVYAEGIGQQGMFFSAPLDLGTDAAKNFERVRWAGQVPETSQIALRFRSGNDLEVWSSWSEWETAQEIPLQVPEPARYLQFEARLASRDLLVGPRLDSLLVEFEQVPATTARLAASVQPNLVPIGVDTTFTYTLTLESDGEAEGIERLAILTSGLARPDLDAVQGLGGSAVDRDASYTTNDSLIVAFAPPLSGNLEITVPFNDRLLTTSHTYRGLAFAPARSGLVVPERSGEDPLTGAPFSLSTEVLNFAIPILDEVEAVPPVFSPNGDRINDEVVIAFTLAKVRRTPVTIEIFDLGGRLVRTLSSTLLDAGRYAPTLGSPSRLPGRWDGRDEEQQIVAPGLYMYRVKVDLEPNDIAISGVVGVAF
jgi:hypothetical protein